MNVTENWDDDFEFNPNSPSRKKKNQNTNSTTTSNNDDDDGIAQETHMSTTSSRLTVDWDAEMDFPVNTSSSHKTKVFTAPNLSDWAEPGPSMPARRPVFSSERLNLTVPTDNWDDDFEDKNNNTPVVGRTRAGQGDQSANSPTKEITRNFRSMQPLPKNESSENPSFSGRNRASSSASTNYYRSHRSTTKHPLSSDLADEEEEEEEEDEFGSMNKDEEDKTLVGRSSRYVGYSGGRVNSMTSATSLTSTSYPLNLTPPPPVPSLPAHLTGGRDTHPEPLPRSPSSSVFSLPTTIAGDSVHYGSTAYLYPTASRTSSSGGGSGRGGGGSGGAKVFSKLPPSPPIHKERERRRLRKKSRPQPQGVFELIPVESSLAALQEVERGERGGEGYYRTSREREDSPGRESARSGTSHSLSRPRTPQRPSTPQSPVLMATNTSAFMPAAENVNANVAATPSSKRHSASSNLPPTPSSSTKGSALLSRIGSVKKWGVRRKRGGSISQNNLPGSPEGPETMDSTLTRPTSSLSSLPSTASSHHASSRPTSPPASKQNWFFRNSDTFTTASGTSASVESAVGQGGQEGQGYPYAYSSNSSRNYSHQNSYHQYHPRGSGTDVRGGSTTELRGSKTDLRSRQGSMTDLGLGSSLHLRSRDGDPEFAPSLKQDRSRTESRARRPSESARDQTRTTSQSRTREGGEVSEKDTPSKLLKRKSLGFVQLRRTIAGLGGNGGDASDSSKGSSSAAPGQPRHVSSGAVLQKSGNGRADVFQDRQNLDMPPPPPPQAAPDGGRERKKSLLKIKARQDVTEGEKEDRKGAGNGFIRSVRRISIVGRHKREKSITTSPVATVPGVEKAARPSLGSRSIAEETKDIKDTEAMEVAPLQDPLAVAVPGIENSSSPATESEAKEANVLVEEAAEPKPVALPQTPPRKRSIVTSSPATPSTSPRLVTMTAATANSPASPTSRGPTTSPQTASLGRSTYSPTRKNPSPEEKVTPRRSSLGDLKIPARISQAQVGLRRDLGMVREFAHNVEQLKELQATYHDLVVEIQELLDNHAHLHATQQVVRSVSPSFFSRPVGRKRSNTNPGSSLDPTRQLAYKQLASAFYTINSKYRITWECAELLIELGGGSSTVPGPPAPTTSVSAPVVQANGDSSLTRRMGRERAITLAGDESKPPSPLPGMKSGLEAQNGAIASSSSVAWRASTGRQELSQRQMILLKELLNNADSSFINSTEDVKPSIQEERSPSANKEWKWGDPSNSTITLPPSESSGAPSSTSSMNAVNNINMKKNRTSRLGMAGLRDLLKMLKRHHTAHPMPSFQSTSSLATNITNSSSDLNDGFLPTSDVHHHPEAEKAATYGRRRAKTSSGPEVVPPPLSIYKSTPLPTRQSRGRPSLASIFRIPNSLKPYKVSGSHAAQANEAAEGRNQTRNAAETSESSSPAEEDWDQIDSATDLDKRIKSSPSSPGRGDGMATIRGRKGQSPYLQHPAPLLPSLLNGGRTSPRSRALNATSSQTSLYEDSPTNSFHNIRSTRLSNVDENAASGPSHTHSAAVQPNINPNNANPNANVKVAPLIPPPRLSSRYPGIAGTNKMFMNGSVRSMPPQPMAELRLAMTPENIKPLVENAKEVNGRLVECIAEIRALLESHKAVVVIEPLQPPK